MNGAEKTMVQSNRGVHALALAWDLVDAIDHVARSDADNPHPPIRLAAAHAVEAEANEWAEEVEGE